MRFGIVVSRFNPEITERLLVGAIDALKEKDIKEDHIKVVHVPGAVEIPLVAQRLAQLGIYDGVVCLGAVIKGETDHYEYVCQQVSYGCQRVALQNDIPLGFGVLTVQDEAHALARTDGRENKGREAALATLEMVQLLRQLS